MEIPKLIRRRYNDAEKHLDETLPTSYYRNKMKEYFIIKTCNDLSVWFNMTYGDKSNLTHLEITSCFMYMFRTKLTLFWENENNV
jgi:glutamyl-tRNA reductase